MGNQAAALKEFFGVATQIRKVLRASHVSDPVVDDVLDRVMGAIDRAYCCKTGISDEAKHSLINLLLARCLEDAAALSGPDAII